MGCGGGQKSLRLCPMSQAEQYERVERGIQRTHRLGCAWIQTGKCGGACPYRAEVYDNITKRAVRKTHKTLSAARRWRADMSSAVSSGAMRVLEPTRFSLAYSRWMSDIVTGLVRTADGSDYKPAVIRAYESKFRNYLVPEFGGMNTNELRTVHVQRLIDKLGSQGQSASTIRNTVMPLRAFYRWLIRNELASVNPCDNVALPSGETARDTVAPPSEALHRLELLRADGRPEWEVALWATAFFTGLRRGELMALDWPSVNLGAAVLRVERSFDAGIKMGDRLSERQNQQIVGWPSSGGGAFVKPKTKNGTRNVGIAQILIPFLARLDRTEGLLFGPVVGRPFKGDVVHTNAKRIWEAAGLRNMTLHEARHTYASLMIAAGVDIVVVSRAMGHSNIAVTVDRYGHLLPDSVGDAASKLDALITASLTNGKDTPA